MISGSRNWVGPEPGTGRRWDVGFPAVSCLGVTSKCHTHPDSVTGVDRRKFSDPLIEVTRKHSVVLLCNRQAPIGPWRPSGCAAAPLSSTPGISVFETQTGPYVSESKTQEDLMTRIGPVQSPYAPEVAQRLEAMMPSGVPPILLFRTAHSRMAAHRTRAGNPSATGC